MKRIIFISIILSIVACANDNADFVESDKIHLLFGDAEYARVHAGTLDDKEKIISDPFNMIFSIHMDIEKVTQVEVSDVSSNNHVCSDDEAPLSPASIASFTLNPKANIKKIDFRYIRLPCAAYQHEFYVMVKVKSLDGNYFMKKKLATLIDVRGDGYP